MSATHGQRLRTDYSPPCDRKLSISRCSISRCSPQAPKLLAARETRFGVCWRAKVSFSWIDPALAVCPLVGRAFASTRSRALDFSALPPAHQPEQPQVAPGGPDVRPRSDRSATVSRRLAQSLWHLRRARGRSGGSAAGGVPGLRSTGAGDHIPIGLFAIASFRWAEGGR